MISPLHKLFDWFSMGEVALEWIVSYFKDSLQAISKCNKHIGMIYSTEPSEWSEWAEYGACSKECGGGEQVWERTCVDSSCPDGDGCPGSGNMTTACNTDCCKGKLF